MTAAAETRVTNLFDQAMQTYGDAMKATVKMQEDATKWWSDILEGGAMQTWQKKSRAIVSDAIPAAQKSAEEWLKMIEQNYRRSMDLLKKAMETDQAGAAADVRAKAQELWEASLVVIRDSAQAMAQANVRFMEQWAEIIKKNANGED
jgi:polyhydroxyalkanoate synthesis regulator protein